MRLRNSLKAAMVALPLLALTTPALAEDWTFFRATDLRRGGVILTTDRNVTHAIEVTLCERRAAFDCLRVSGGFTLAVPKARLLPQWEFEGTRYQLLDDKAGFYLLGKKVDGMYVRAINGKGEEAVFFYSPVRGFLAFQWVTVLGERPMIFIATGWCGPAAQASCAQRGGGRDER